MPLLSTITTRQLAGTSITFGATAPTTNYLSFLLNADSYNEGQTITATLTTANIPNGTTVNYSVTGMAASDIVGGNLSGTITINNNSGVAQFVLVQDGLTEGPDTFTITLAATDSAGNSTGSLSDNAVVADTSNDPLNTQWLDNNNNPVTVRLIIGATSMQFNGVFNQNPTVPRTVEGRTSGTRTTITAITARTGTFIEVDDSGNSTNFVIGEQLNLVP